MRIYQFLLILITSIWSNVNTNAQIYYQDIIPDDTLSTWSLRVVNIDSSATSSLSFHDPGNLSIWEEFDSRIVVNAFSDCEVLMNNNYPIALNQNMLISSAGTWMQPNYHILNNGSQGNWIGVTDKYLGVRIKSGTQWLYGWVRMDVNVVGTSVTIKDYACNRTPDTSINAGQTISTEINNSVNSGENLIFVYPNPACKELTINFPTNKNYNKQIELKIFNDVGQQVLQQEIFNNATILDVSQFTKGIYFICITVDNQIIYRNKLIIIEHN